MVLEGETMARGASSVGFARGIAEVDPANEHRTPGHPKGEIDCYDPYTAQGRNHVRKKTRRAHPAEDATVGESGHEVVFWSEDLAEQSGKGCEIANDASS